VENDRVVIPGSELRPRNNEHALSPASPSLEVTATILLRRNTNAGGPSEQELLSGKYYPSAEGQAAARAAIAAAPEDVAAVRSFAEQYGLKVVDADPDSRRVRVEGTASAMDKAFGVHLQQTAEHILTYAGSISVPKPLAGIVTAVLGLDQRPVASPRDRT
jgi:kumamolisin